MDSRRSIVPVLSFSGHFGDAHRTPAYHVALNFTDRLQNAIGSKPEHMTVLPPDIMGAKRFLTMPPIWKRGIIFTVLDQLTRISLLLSCGSLTIDISWPEVPRMHDAETANYQG
jgi:hypothetical protein